MHDVPTQVLLLAIFVLIVITAILFRARISLRVKNWFDLDAKPTTPTTVDVGKRIDIRGGKLGEAVGVREPSANRDIQSVSVLKEANAQGATIDRLVGIDQTGDAGK